MGTIVEPGDGTGAVRAARREVMEAAGLSIARVSREIGLANATLGRWLRGGYPGDVPKVTARVSSWLQTRREGAAHFLAGAGIDRFAATGASAKIADALSDAQASGDIVLVHGPSGRGKTRTAAHYRAAHTGVACLSATGAMVTMPGLLGCVLEAVCGYRERGSALEAERAVVESLRGRGALLMIDEAHYLRAGLLDELRRIRGHAGLGLALIGNDGVRMTLERCPRVLGRTGMQVDLRHLAERDVAAIAMAGLLGRRPGKAELEVPVRAARGRGGPHTLRRVLTEAWKLSRAEGGGPIDAGSVAVAAEAVTGQEGHEGEGAGRRAADDEGAAT